MSISSLALFGFRLRGFKAHPWRAFHLPKLDELSCGASRQRIRYFVAKIGDWFQVMARLEKLVERFAGEGENLVEGLILGVDKRHQGGGGKIDPRDATVSPASGPARTASVSNREVFLVTLSFTNQISLQRF